VNPPSPDHYLPGAEGRDTAGWFSSFHVNGVNAAPIALGMLQPY
jgi:hypothetical protein